MLFDTFILDYENEKAFETPPHDLLKNKLFGCGIGGKTLKWKESILCYRQQRKSDWASVLSGVPKGTGLGPLLFFFLYINDISTDIDSEIRLFADGCVCYREIKDTKDTSKLQKDIDQLEYWSRKWGMRFPPVKCRMSSKNLKQRSERFVTGNYNFETGSMTGILEHLKWESLKK